MSLTKNGKLGIVAVVAVALVAAGAAYAATTFHGKGSSQARGGFGGPAGGMGRGYGGPSGFPGGGRGPGFRAGGGGPFGELSAVASYLGVSQSSLFQSLRSGKTLAQLANATSGKSESGLVDALVSAETKQIDAEVKAGRLSQSQADQLTSNLKTRITSLVEGTARGFGRGGFGGPPGNGYGGGGFGEPPSQSGGTTQPNHI